jgi:iron(III) transport system ATP-binding protein
MLELVELGHLGERYPHELSGGQQQRVALARALAYEPTLLLLDEPFSNLDAKLRERARDWLRRLQRQIAVTTVFVTHDQDEALSMSDRVVVMNGGKVLQMGSPEDIYRRPAEMFVADFVGSLNVLPAEVVEADGTSALVRLPGVERPLRVASDLLARGPVHLVVRPEALVVHAPDRAGTVDGPPNAVPGRTVDRAYLGDHYRYGVEVAGARIHVTSVRGDLGDEMLVEIPPGEARLFARQQTPDENQEQA